MLARKRRAGRKKMAGVCFLLPGFLGVLFFTLLPFIEVVKRSFQSAITLDWVGFKNYKEVFSNTAFRMAAGNTLRFTLICIPLLVVVSLILRSEEHTSELQSPS